VAARLTLGSPRRRTAPPGHEPRFGMK